MVVLTTNHLDVINPAMLRPGRLDAVIEVTAPDQAAVERLIRVYAREMLTEDVDVSHVAQQLAGQIPAVVREVVERSKLYWLTRTGGKGPLALEEEDLSYAASTVLTQRKLTERPAREKKTAMQLFGSAIGDAIAMTLGTPGHSPTHYHDIVGINGANHRALLDGTDVDLVSHGQQD
jgi:transitional endoplasmic reticulum ATPase